MGTRCSSTNTAVSMVHTSGSENFFRRSRPFDDDDDDDDGDNMASMK
jgi:hypothetical protein